MPQYATTFPRWMLSNPLTTLIAAHERCLPSRSARIYMSLINQILILKTGAMVLAHSLRDKGAKAKIVVLATLDALSSDTITELKVNIPY